MFKTLIPATLIAISGTMAAAEEVHVYNWSDYIDPALLQKFEDQTGIKLVYDVFDSNEVLETKLLSGSSGYDVVVPTGSFLERQIQAGVFQKLDYSKMPNSKYLWDKIKERTAQYDPGNQYAVNYMWGTTGIGINDEKVKEVLGADAPVDSLSLVFDPKYMKKLQSCGVMMLDAPTEMIPAALRYLGEDPNSKDPKVIEKAEPVLEAIRPYVRKFNSSEYINSLANGDICVAFGWSGDILQARDRAAEAKNGVTISYHIPKEGALMWFDMMAIPADAPNPSGAEKFINFMMDPENIAAASNYVNYANGNKESQKYLDKSVIDDPAIYPPAATMDNLYTVTAYPPKVKRIVTRLWTKVKSGT
ncbi:polyamine ABC transporter substrate-binding protein [Thioclava sp. BHET1]|uniref:Putrescine-binding periplasmic protein n=1 Tax=Thioclava dalianensis TaxID=1185766 RepID=A0A074TI69_9RHOB|nr:polyamine ABC transporter substrate-binding protein [Thioclava dalianensis]KEP71411.1 spermidine/putrescine ABC transporter substrate-binding protein [Thioclava dalianensis]TMV92098.1 polyamine ABC transporter substrate-binding protein [Thioclava sp. BHET1]SFM79412.1 putrescine transport system substrate-binding protein [Thioclava dalianensis]